MSSIDVKELPPIMEKAHRQGERTIVGMKRKVVDQKKEENPAIYHNMDGAQGHYAK